MDAVVVVAIGGRSCALRLDLLTLRETERAVPGLCLLTSEGWNRVASSAEVFLALLWAAMHDDPERPSLEDLGQSVALHELPELQTVVTSLYVEAVFLGHTPESREGVGDPRSAPPGATSGPSGGASSDSESTSSGG